MPLFMITVYASAAQSAPHIAAADFGHRWEAALCPCSQARWRPPKAQTTGGPFKYKWNTMIDNDFQD